ncbi:hypothetical protein VCHA53O466_40352 [Vibrio chagasii]|nr:hypothetical protein VCHA53O466_40352 [Vibrio chagasii]
MSSKLTSFSDLVEIKALEAYDLCNKAVDRNNSQSAIDDQHAREAIFRLASAGEFEALNKISRGLSESNDASMFFEINEGDAICASVQEAEGRTFICTTVFIPLSFSVSPLTQNSELLESFGINPILTSTVTKGLREQLAENFNLEFDLLPFLLDEIELASVSNKGKVKKLAELYGSYSLAKKFNNTNGHEEKLVDFLTNSFDIETPMDFSQGTFDIIKFAVGTFCIETTDTKALGKPSTLGWGLPVKLLSNASREDISSERNFINKATSILQLEYNKIEDIDLVVCAGSPQSYTMLDYGHILTTAGNIVTHMSSLLSSVAHCELVVEVDQSNSDITLSYRFKRSKDQYDNEHMNLQLPYMPYRYNNPLTEIELQKTYMEKIIGISCTLEIGM